MIINVDRQIGFHCVFSFRFDVQVTRPQCPCAKCKAIWWAVILTMFLSCSLFIRSPLQFCLFCSEIWKPYYVLVFKEVTSKILWSTNKMPPNSFAAKFYSNTLTSYIHTLLNIQYEWHWHLVGAKTFPPPDSSSVHCRLCAYHATCLSWGGAIIIDECLSQNDYFLQVSINALLL